MHLTSSTVIQMGYALSSGTKIICLVKQDSLIVQKEK